MNVELSELPERVARAVRERREILRFLDGDQCLGVMLPNTLPVPPDLTDLYAQLPPLAGSEDILRAERDAA